jgi:hypothetical protein
LHARPKDSWPGSNREVARETTARENVWPWDFRRGVQTNEVAAREPLGARGVQSGAARAGARERKAINLGNSEARPPRLLPLFPVGSYTPHSKCAHNSSIRYGSRFCCMVCHRSGMDGHPALQRDPRTDPLPERKAALAPVPRSTGSETRKQRRERLFGAPTNHASM